MPSDWGDRVLLIVEDHPAAARGLERRVRLEKGPSTRVAPDFRVASACLSDSRICAAIIDVQLPGGCGLDLIPMARTERPGMPILVLTGHIEPIYANRAQSLGAEFAFKGESGEGEAVRSFLQRLSKRLLESDGESALASFAIRHGFSPAEVEIVRMRLEGLRNKEIAARRGVQLNTIKSEVKQLLRRCNATRLEDVCQAVRRLSRTA